MTKFGSMTKTGIRGKKGSGRVRDFDKEKGEAVMGAGRN